MVSSNRDNRTNDVGAPAAEKIAARAEWKAPRLSSITVAQTENSDAGTSDGNSFS